MNFEKEILPLLTKNCVACHNTKKAENSLVLETHADDPQGGDSGPAVVAKKSGRKPAAQSGGAPLDEPAMPPADNKVGAVDLTSDQLGLIKLWIDQGATGEIAATARPSSGKPCPRA